MSVYENLLCECGGRLLQRNISKRSKNLYIKRTRRCEKCHKIIHTIEMPIDTYDKSVEVLNKIILVIKDSQNAV